MPLPSGHFGHPGESVAPDPGSHLEELPGGGAGLCKSGRAETPQIRAFSMMETTVMLKPESEWRRGMTGKLVRRWTVPFVSWCRNAWTMRLRIALTCFLRAFALLWA